MIRKIIFIESAGEMGGVEFSTLYLASHLDTNSWQPIVVCPSEGKLSSACREAALDVVIIPIHPLAPTSFRVGIADTRIPNPLAWFWNIFFIWDATGWLWKFLARTKPDLVITKGLYAHFFGGLAARLAQVKCIWHVQDFISERFWGLYRAFFGLAASVLPDEIVVDGTPIANQLPKKIQSRVHVVLNGVDVTVFRPSTDSATVRHQLRLNPEDLVIGHAARITPWKGQHHLLEAFKKVAARHPQVHLLLVGAPIFDNDIYEQRLRRRTEEMGMFNRVTFAGFRVDLPQVLQAMDIFAYPSVEKDTSPLALLSALACGLPVVAFDIDGVKEVLGETGLLVPVRDENKMSEALEKLIEDTSLRKRMGVLSRKKALQEFSLEQYVKSMEKVFLQVNI